MWLYLCAEPQKRSGLTPRALDRWESARALRAIKQFPSFEFILRSGRVHARPPVPRRGILLQGAARTPAVRRADGRVSEIIDMKTQTEKRWCEHFALLWVRTV